MAERVFFVFNATEYTNTKHLTVFQLNRIRQLNNFIGGVIARCAAVVRQRLCSLLFFSRAFLSVWFLINKNERQSAKYDGNLLFKTKTIRYRQWLFIVFSIFYFAQRSLVCRMTIRHCIRHSILERNNNCFNYEVRLQAGPKSNERKIPTKCQTRNKCRIQHVKWNFFQFLTVIRRRSIELKTEKFLRNFPILSLAENLLGRKESLGWKPKQTC